MRHSKVALFSSSTPLRAGVEGVAYSVFWCVLMTLDEGREVWSAHSRCAWKTVLARF